MMDSDSPSSYDIDAAFAAFVPKLSYLPPNDIDKVKAAFACAREAHASQKRASGEPYISHPLAVASVVVAWHMDTDAVCAALLHDVLEDTGVKKTTLAAQFGNVVADLVDGLSKLDKMDFASYREAQAENFRKMLLAMARDLRVVLIKLADRLHNMRTMQSMRPDKQRRIAHETQEIYAPIALRLGLMTVYRELQDICYALIYPTRARVFQQAMINIRHDRTELSQKITDAMRQRLHEMGVEVDILVREKGIFATVEQMKKRKQSFHQTLDIHNFRILTHKIPDCYLALGALHSLYSPKPGSFQDYIALPKPNGYQSLHTSLIGPYGTPISAHIRTRDMHNVAEEGVSTFWLRQGQRGDESEQDVSSNLPARSHLWLQSLLDIQGKDSSEFFDNVKIDLFPDEVYVFTPKGRIFPLPAGATVLDFAYTVHTDVGNHAVGAVVNGNVTSLRQILQNGDIVSIQTRDDASPKPTWLSFIHTGRARSRIRHALRALKTSEALQLGKQLLERELLIMGIVRASLPSHVWDDLVQSSAAKNMDDIYVDIGTGQRSASVVAQRLIARENIQTTKHRTEQSAITIHGDEGMAIQLARCCYPIPGDTIIGSIKKGRGLIVHASDCPTIVKSLRSEPQKWLNVMWQNEEDRFFNVRLRVETDKERGILSKVAAIITEAGANIEHINMAHDSESPITAMDFILQVHHRIHLANVIRQIKHLSAVHRIMRERGNSDTIKAGYSQDSLDLE